MPHFAHPQKKIYILPRAVTVYGGVVFRK